MVLNEVAVRARNLWIGYEEEGEILWALNGIDIDIPKATAFCIVGESGSGKSTLGNAIAGLLPPYAVTKGRLDVYNISVIDGDKVDYSGVRGSIVVRIPQNPLSALNPYLKIESVFSDILKQRFRINSKVKALEIAQKALKAVDLPSDVLGRYPHQLSGGMGQRVAIALTIAIDPEIVVADEPTSNLDAYLKGATLNLLRDIVRKGKTLIVITHDILFASALCSFIAVMLMGNVVEIGKTEEVLSNPLHPYTRELIDAANLNFKNSKYAINRSKTNLRGCAYSSRCPKHSARCYEKPKLFYINESHGVACWNL
ncbi:MAG: ABC transporter ATP-binding protein [Ignisphaera sp.]|nr:ABC transporter ATP-binding protein [Ignisphaera sp.]MCX8167602.1 ABC transporter ATP-binding protein [Ignisphaera sp.]MDW8085422.1 ABC transporter ATP-binding protein [Ignisphaera sp.]